MKPLNVLLLPASLQSGGTERQVTELAIGLHRKGHQVTVATPYAHDRYQSDLEAAGVSVVILNLGPRPGKERPVKRVLNVLSRSVATVRLIDRSRFDVVYGFGSTTNFYAAAMTVFSKSKVVWGIRDSRPGPPKGFYLVERLLSRRARLVIANSGAGKTSWINRGLPGEKVVVIHNGTDFDRFCISESWRSEVRDQLGLTPDTPLIGIVGRTHPVKDHELFIRSARHVAEYCPNARFVIVGSSTPDRTNALMKIASEEGVVEKLLWAGSTHQPEKFFNAIDVHVSCSLTEGFSNVLVESMACGTPSVATNVGDAETIIGELGRTVTSRNPIEIARAVSEVLNSESLLDREAIRLHVSTRFSVRYFVDRSESRLREVMGRT
jgi:glycosyltransferase involved in cell wall biosynthesis